MEAVREGRGVRSVPNLPGLAINELILHVNSMKKSAIFSKIFMKVASGNLPRFTAFQKAECLPLNKGPRILTQRKVQVSIES
jgi:hypothetical protein